MDESASHNGTDHAEEVEDEEDEEDAESLIEDALDEIEMNPYLAAEGEAALSDQECEDLRAELRQTGPDAFITKYLEGDAMDARTLCVAFGMDPSLELEDVTFLRLLGGAIVRAYYKRSRLTQYSTIDDAASLLRKSHNIIVITGAGISTSLGIPDFRSKHTGFYDQVREQGYEEPEEVFNIHNFKADPQIFYNLAGGILPDLKQFSPTHAFVRLLQDKNRLQTQYTQNIDNLEQLAGIDPDRLVQCHGSFATATCLDCQYKVPGHKIFEDIRAKRVARCESCLRRIALPRAQKKHKSSNKPSRDSDPDDVPEPGVMKPDITFFGEPLPNEFFERFTERDVKAVDLVIVIGTKLTVAPVSEMPNYLPHNVPHIFISREPIEHVNFDIQLLGDCDHVVFEICRRAGWSLEHKMVPGGFKVSVTPVEGSEYRWQVKPVIDAVDEH